MAERQRGPAGGLRNGRLLDSLTVRIDVDLTGFRRGMAEAIAQIRTLRGAISGQMGGVSLGDAMTAAIVAPLTLAATRIGSMRTELRALTNEMRQSAALLGGPVPGGGRSLVVAGGGPVLEAGRRVGVDGRPVMGRVNNRWAPQYDVFTQPPPDADAPNGYRWREGNAGGAGAWVPVGGYYDEQDARARGGGGGGSRSRGSWWSRTPGQAWSAATNTERMNNAAGSLGFNAGRGLRGGMRNVGGVIGRGIGASIAGSLVGGAAGGALGGESGALMGALLGGTLGPMLASIIPIAGNLATVVGGVLAGAFAALLTPIGLVVAAIAGLIALFAASNWDQIRAFFAWFGEQWDALARSDAYRAMMAGWNELRSAVGELWETIRVAFHDDSGSIGVILRTFGEIVLTVVRGAMTVIGNLLTTIADIVRGVAALIRGDWSDAWDHFSNAITRNVDAGLASAREFFRDLEDLATGWWDGPGGRAMRNLARFGLVGALVSGSEVLDGDGGDDTRGGGPANDNLGGGKSSRGGGKMFGGLGARFGQSVGLLTAKNDNGFAFTDAQEERMQRMTSLAQGFGQALERGLDAATRGGMKFSDVLRQIAIDIINMLAQMLVIQPLSQQFGNALQGIFSGGMGGGGKSGGGGFLGAIGNFFGGFFAKGGELAPGKWGIVGEMGPEIVVGGRHGKTIFPGGANDNMRVDARAFINAQGADPEAIARLQAALARRDAELPAQIAAHVGNMRQRGRL